ncbi:ATP-binding protein [Rhizobium sp. PAMB 3174]
MRSIRLRFLIVSLIGITIALSLAAWFFVILFTRNLQARIDGELSGYIGRLAATLQFDDAGALKRPEQLADNRFYQPYGGLYWQIEDAVQSVRMRSPSLFDYALPLPADTHEPGTIHRYRLPGPDGNDVMVQERIIVLAAPGGKRDIRIAVAIDAAGLDNASRRFARTILPYILALALLLSLMSAAQLSFGLRPLSRLAEDVRKIRERRALRLDGQYPSELSGLSSQLNQLIEAQEKTVESARTRAADLAHGLKTPLTVLANDALTLREKGETEIADELEALAATMRAHVDHELARARMAPSAEQRRSDASLKAVVDGLIRTLHRSPDGERLDWRSDIPEHAVVPVDPQDAREMLGNILENAAKWAAASVAVGAVMTRNGWRLTIEDDGPGVSPDKLGDITARGLRLDHRKPGSGLGLAIVTDIATLYDIDVAFDNRAEGGLRATFLFPRL